MACTHGGDFTEIPLIKTNGRKAEPFLFTEKM